MSHALRRLSLVAAIMLSLVASTALAPGVAQAGPTVCNPGQTLYKVTSTTLKAKVTKWGVYIKNDNSKTTITMKTTKSSTLKTTVTKKENLSGGIVLKQVANVTVGKGNGQVKVNKKAKTATYTEKNEFKKPGEWVIGTGHMVGKGHVIKQSCKQSGNGFTRIGSADGKTYKKAPFAGVINCQKKVKNKPARAMKAKCPS